MAQRQAAGRSWSPAPARGAALDACAACEVVARSISAEHAAEVFQVHCDHMPNGVRGGSTPPTTLEPPPQGMATHHRIAPVENGDDLALVSRESHHVRRIWRSRAQNPGACSEAKRSCAAGVGNAQSNKFAQAFRRRHRGARKWISARRARASSGAANTELISVCRSSALTSCGLNTPRFQGPSPRT